MLIDEHWIALQEAAVKDHVRDVFKERLGFTLFSIDQVEASFRVFMQRLGRTVLEAWATQASEAATELARQCPGCGERRKVHQRAPMPITVLGVQFELPKPYLECSRCEAKGVSIMPLLTGLRAGSTSAEVALMSAYGGAAKSYGDVSRELEVHHGIDLDRNAVRRDALKVEKEAIRYAQAERARALAAAGREEHTEGVPRLILQADGGSIRTGQLRPTRPGDAHHGEKTKTGRSRRVRDDANREMIVMDVREPGSLDSCRDVFVPSTAGDNERWHAMLATAQRAGLGDNTRMLGLGDMGSCIAKSFDEAFLAYEAQYCADWKHLCDYVASAAEHIAHKEPKRWAERIKDALWNRDRKRVDRLLASAQKSRVKELPPHLDKCPVQTLCTYVDNNWERFHSKAFKDEGVDFVSARAEAQVRDSIKSRFSTPGAWNVQNIEGKGVLRAIIADGRWFAFRDHYLRTRGRRFDSDLRERLDLAVAQSLLHEDALNPLSLPNHDTLPLAA